MKISRINQVIDADAVSKSKSSLLIPRNHLNFFHARCRMLGSRARYFKYMVQKYFPMLGLWKSKLIIDYDPAWKTHYQASGLDLQKKNFIPDNSDWEEFRHLATALGVSICFLFAFLLELEASGFFESKPQSDIFDKLIGWISSVLFAFFGIASSRFSKMRRELLRKRTRLRRRIKFR